MGQETDVKKKREQTEKLKGNRCGGQWSGMPCCTSHKLANAPSMFVTVDEDLAGCATTMTRPWTIRCDYQWEHNSQHYNDYTTLSLFG
eukprot:2981274-Amphidinium_carterae.2